LKKFDMKNKLISKPKLKCADAKRSTGDGNFLRELY